MKILLDSCLSFRLQQALKEKGHIVEWTGEWPRDPGDEEILAHAYTREQVLVTLDKDFGELAIVHHQAHVGIVRLVNMSIQSQVNTCLYIFEHYAQDLEQSAIITAEAGRLRIRSGEK